MKILTLLLLLGLPLLAQTSRETFRDSTGRIVKTIEYRKIHNGTQAVIRDVSGRIIGSSKSTKRP